ncbi:peptidylprolyl isomerase [candidate division WOR-3 bacterium]|nr:peptidylprolyl isomerase [candidate division WOR-3 bacterium]
MSLLVLGLSFCAKKPEPEPVKATLAEPDEFGIARRIWGEEVTAQDRVDAAAQVKNHKIEFTGSEKATVQTNKGDFVIELYPDDAPSTVANFVRLSQVGFFDGLIWHRYEEDFLIQGGDPTGSGNGNPGYTIPFEQSPKKHEKGSVAMARVGSDLNSGSCQFYICLTPQPHLDGSYCVFGKVVEGMDVVYQIRASDSILKITVTR